MSNNGTLLGKEKLLYSNSNIKHKKKKKEIVMTEEEKAINFKIFKNMNRKLNYLKNPRFRNNNQCLLYSNDLFKEVVSQENPFVVDPPVVIFREYHINNIYEIDLKLTNRRDILQSFKFIPPQTEYFAIKRISYPKKDSSLIAPGMCARIEVIFNALTRDSVQDELTIITENYAFKVKLLSIEEKPALSLENPMDCNKCFVGDQISMLFHCKNIGGSAHFKFIIDQGVEFVSQHGEDYNEDYETFMIDPFIIFPQEFYLMGSKTGNIEVIFKPNVEGNIERNLFIACDSKINLPWSIKGEGIMVDMQLVSLDGLNLDETYEKLETILFDDTYPNTKTSRNIKIKNNCSLPLKYHWSIYDNFENNLFEENFNFFEVEPEKGLFKPNEELSFKITFMPRNSLVYEQKLDLIIEDVPLQAFKKFTEENINFTYKQSIIKDEPYMLALNSPYPMFPIYNFFLKGKGKLCYLEVNSNLINLGEVYIGEKISRIITIHNPKSGMINFQMNKNLQTLRQSPIIINKIKEYFNEFPADHILSIKKPIDIPKRIKSPMSRTNTFIPIYSDKSGANELSTNVEFLKLFIKSEHLSEINQNVHKPPISKKLSGRKSILNTLSRKVNSILSELPLSNVNIILKENVLLKINSLQKINIDIEFIPKKTGLFSSALSFLPNDGLPVIIDIKCNIVGPKLLLDTADINFGLFQLSTIQKKCFKIKNICPVEATFLIKESKYRFIDFDNYKNSDYMRDTEGIINSVEFRKKIDNVNDYDHIKLQKMNILEYDSYQLKFSKPTGIIQPGEELEIIVSFYSKYPKLLEDVVEIMIENSESIFLNIFADCQESYAYVENPIIEPKNIFLSVPIQSNNNIIKLVNPSNLPVRFKWENIFEKDKRIVEFKPHTGVIDPNSYILIEHNITYYSICKVDDLYICNIEEMLVPLGVIVKGTVTGLDIKYELTNETLLQLLRTKSPIEAEEFQNYLYNKARKRLQSNQVYDKTFNEIDIRDIKVNRSYSLSFTISNSSGIPTNFSIFCKNYLVERKVENRRLSKLTNTISDSSAYSLKKKQFVIDHNLLTDKHENLQFTSEKGLDFNKMRQAEMDSAFYLNNGKGIAIVINPINGKLEPNSEVTIQIDIYNEMIGDFNDEIHISIKSLPTRIIPIRLKIRGNPLQIYPFQPGIDYLSFPSIVKIGHVLTKVGHLEKLFKLYNIGSNLLSIIWKIYDYNDIIYPKKNILKITLNENKGSNNSTFNINCLPEEPLEMIESHFNITPRKFILNPKGTADFRISFCTDKEGLQSVLMVAYPKFEDSSINAKLSELAIKVDAFGVKPMLVVDKLKNNEDKYIYKFDCHSYGISPRPKRSLILINKEKINLIVRLQVEGPFKIIKIEPFEATIGNNLFNIIPNSNLKVELKFLNPDPKNEIEWPYTLVNQKSGKLSVVFENNEVVEYDLIGFLKRPKIILSTTGNESIQSSNYIDFGLVNCQSSKRASIYLSNLTEVDAKWSLNYIKHSIKKNYGYSTTTSDEKEDLKKNDDSTVFDFSLTDGIIAGPSIQLINIPIGPALPKVYNQSNEKYNPIKIDILFKPKFNVFYKCRYRIITETGNSIDFILKGTGSYQEEYL